MFDASQSPSEQFRAAMEQLEKEGPSIGLMAATLGIVSGRGPEGRPFLGVMVGPLRALIVEESEARKLAEDIALIVEANWPRPKSLLARLRAWLKERL